MREACARCFERAWAEAVAGARYAAWDCLHQFDDEWLAALDAQERAARWCSLQSEAKDKLSGWRAKAAEALAARVPDRTQVDLATLRELHGHLAASAQNPTSDNSQPASRRKGTVTRRRASRIASSAATEIRR